MDDGQGYKTNPNQVDHRAQAYVAPLKKPLVQSNTENTETTAAATAAKAPGERLYFSFYLLVFLTMYEEQYRYNVPNRMICDVKNKQLLIVMSRRT